MAPHAALGELDDDAKRVALQQLLGPSFPEGMMGRTRLVRELVGGEVASEFPAPVLAGLPLAACFGLDTVAHLFGSCNTMTCPANSRCHTCCTWLLQQLDMLLYCQLMMSCGAAAGRPQMIYYLVLTQGQPERRFPRKGQAQRELIKIKQELEAAGGVMLC